MKSKVENVEKNVVKLTIEVDSDNFRECLKKAYMQNKGRFNIPGFRKGKAPLSMIERYYGEQIFYEDAFNLACPEAYEKAIEENNLQPVDRPELDIEQIGKDQNLIFTAKVTVKPEVKLGEYKGLKVEKDLVVVTEEDVEQELKRVQDRNSRLVTVEDRPVQDGDTLSIDFEGSVDGELFEGGAAKGYTLVIGSGTFIPGFEEQLIGVEKGQEVDVHVAFPEEYHSEALKGKPAVFKVTVHEIKHKEQPELDDEFAQDVSEYDTLAEYKEDIKNKLIKNKEDAASKKYENDIVKKAAENAEMDIPDVMIERQLDNILRRMDMTLQYQGMNLESYMNMMGMEEAALRNDYREKAIQDVKTQLVLEEISRVENVQASDEEVEAEIAETAENYKQNVEDFKKHLKNDDIEYIKDTVITKKTIKLMME